MGGDSWAQEGYPVRFDWGPAAASRVAGGSGTLVIVDVLSFTTSVAVAVERGVAVYPAALGDAAAGRLAEQVGGVVAVGRHAVTAEHPWSLSPAALQTAPAPARLVLPSPNGSAIAAAAGRRSVVAASLRNARAVAGWLHAQHPDENAPLTVIAAGERWPDGSLRPALEDLLGAGALLAALAGHGGGRQSPEAVTAAAAYTSTENVADAVRRCASGVELVTGGFGDDVELAVQVDASAVVPVLADGAFRRV